MSKLLELKQWVSIEDAVRHLSALLGEVISDADILQLALDGHLKISARFVNHTMAKPCRRVPIGKATVVPGIAGGEVVLGIRISEEEVLEIDDDITTLSGVWDLPMIGGEQLSVKTEYQQRTHGPGIELISIDGAFVEDWNGTIYQLQEELEERRSRDPKHPYRHERSYYPPSELPGDCVLVVRTANLTAFVQRVLTTQQPAQISDRERDTLQKQIAGLALLLAEKASLYKLGDKPNASQIADAVSDLLSTLPDANLHGMSKSAIRGSIRAGLDLLRK